MKFIAKLLIMMLMTTSLIGCSSKGVAINPTIEIGQSTQFNEEEIEEAVKCVSNNFEFEACSLTKIRYDESDSNTLVENYLEFGKGLDKEIDFENVIALLVDFSVDESGDNLVLNPGEIYSDYTFILIRDDEDSSWEIDDWGF